MKIVTSLVLLAGVCQGLFFTLEGNSEKCFSLRVRKGHEFWAAYVISGKGDRNVLTQIFESDGSIQYASPKKSREGSLELVSGKGGLHQMCFKALDRHSKTVSFEFTSQEEAEEGSLATEEELTPLRNGLKQLSKKLDSVYRNLHFYERRERIHRDLIEQTCDRVLWAGLSKMLVLISVSCLQVYLLRGFFEGKKGTSI